MVRIMVDANDGGSLVDEFIKAAREAESRMKSTGIVRDRHQFTGQFNAYKVAVELADAAERSKRDGTPVEIRDYDEIVKEHGD